MFRIIDEKDSGKTRKLLNECSQNKGLFVCRHPERVLDKCSAYGIPVVDSIGYEDYLTALRKKDEKLLKKSVYIDELEEFLEIISPNIKGYSFSK